MCYEIRSSRQHGSMHSAATVHPPLGNCHISPLSEIALNLSMTNLTEQKALGSRQQHHIGQVTRLPCHRDDISPRGTVSAHLAGGSSTICSYQPRDSRVKSGRPSRFRNSRSRSMSSSMIREVAAAPPAFRQSARLTRWLATSPRYSTTWE